MTFFFKRKHKIYNNKYVFTENDKIRNKINITVKKHSNNGTSCQMCGVVLNDLPEKEILDSTLYKKNHGHHKHQFICSDCEKGIKEFIRYGKCTVCGKEIKVFNEKLKFDEFDPMTYYYSLFGNVCYECYRKISKEY